MNVRASKIWVLVFGLWFIVTACTSYRGAEAPSKIDRGLKFNHELHAEQGIDCIDCHSIEVSEDEAILASSRAQVARPQMPTHDLCGLCHEVVAEEDDTSTSTCMLCHSRSDQLVDATFSVLDDEKRFDHETHIAAEVECSACHANPDERRLPKQPLMEFCMDCHGETRVELNECSVCHKILSTETRPEYRDGLRLAHDIPQVWERIHGRESAVDPEFCAMCHSSEAHCEECHRTNAPQTHTASWRRKTHGLRASWDRRACATCHEEDSCLKCHQNTKPASHRGRWDGPQNGHCVSCHLPAERTNCTVCHESIEHVSARPSPHNLGIFPTDCSRCHPGGLPQRAPHAMNSTVRCFFCHR